MQKTQVQSLGSEDPQEKEIGYPLQYSCLENSMDREAWQAIVRGWRGGGGPQRVKHN